MYTLKQGLVGHWGLSKAAEQLLVVAVRVLTGITLRHSTACVHVYTCIYMLGIQAASNSPSWMWYIVQ